MMHTDLFGELVVRINHPVEFDREINSTLHPLLKHAVKIELLSNDERLVLGITTETQVGAIPELVPPLDMLLEAWWL